MIVHVSHRKYSLRNGNTSANPNTHIGKRLCLLQIMNNKRGRLLVFGNKMCLMRLTP